MIARTALGILLFSLLMAPLASAHANTRAVDDLLPPGFTQVPPSLLGREERPATELPSSGGMGEYQVTFRCPEIADDPSVPPEVRNRTREVAQASCPMHIMDPHDIMGSPILLVDPRDPMYVGFNALHGGRGVHQIGREPPSNQSRDNFLHQTHTTFYSGNGGSSWNDNPYYSPLQMPKDPNVEDPTTFFPAAQLSGKQVFGEDNAAVLDAQGRVYLASLYAYRNVTDSGAWSYAIGLWKSNRVNIPVDYFNGVKLLKLPAGMKADSIHAVYLHDIDRVAVIWRESRIDDPKTSYLNLTWTIPGKGAMWYEMKPNQRIQGCTGISNPLAYRGIIYVGCFAGLGYRVANATINHLQIHAIDARNNAFTQSHVDETPVARSAASANAVLFDRTDGKMGVASAGIAADGRPFLNLAYGELGTRWDDVEKFGARIAQLVLRPPAPAYEVVEAQVNAAGYVSRSGNVHLIYQERYKPNDEQAQVPNSNVAEFYKGFVSIHTGSDRIVNKIVHLGARNRDAGDSNAQDAASPCQLFEARYQGPTQDVFRDLHDSIVIWEPDRKTHKNQREFIAYADCGNVRYAEVFEEEFIPWVGSVPLGTSPIPAPLTAANPSLTGAAAGALAGAMVLRMLAFKRKLAVEAPA